MIILASAIILLIFFVIASAIVERQDKISTSSLINEVKNKAENHVQRTQDVALYMSDRKATEDDAWRNTLSEYCLLEEERRNKIIARLKKEERDTLLKAIMQADKTNKS
ncbi:MAG: hypothetical protein ACI4M9_04540 [Succinivibrio sp.]